MWRQSTLPHLGQSPLMVNSASSLTSSRVASSPFKRLDARVGCERSLEAFLTLFCGGGLQRNFGTFVIFPFQYKSHCARSFARCPACCKSVKSMQ